MSFAFEHLKLRRIILVLCSALDLTELPYPSSNSLPKRPSRIYKYIIGSKWNGFHEVLKSGCLDPPQALSWGEGGAEGQEDFRLYHNEIYLTPPPPSGSVIL